MSPREVEYWHENCIPGYGIFNFTLCIIKYGKAVLHAFNYHAGRSRFIDCLKHQAAN